MIKVIATFILGALALSAAANVADRFVEASVARPAGTAGFTPDEMTAYSEDR